MEYHLINQDSKVKQRHGRYSCDEKMLFSHGRLGKDNHANVPSVCWIHDTHSHLISVK
jgi:hypothetical protein